MVGNVGTVGSSTIQYLHSRLRTNRVKVIVHETAGDGLNYEIAPRTIQLRRVSNADGQPEE